MWESVYFSFEQDDILLIVAVGSAAVSRACHAICTVCYNYFGPIEVFGASGAKIFTVGQSKATVESVYGLKVTPDYDFSDLPEVDVLLVPGGGVIEAWKNPQLLNWIKERSKKVRVVMSVCSGAFILGNGALHLVERELGSERALTAAQYMEYDWKSKNK